jgi:hypothetical protein
VLKTTVKVEHIAYSLSFLLNRSSFKTSYRTFPTLLICAKRSLVKEQLPIAYVWEQWTASVAGDMLWLPPEYCLKCVTTHGNIVVLGFFIRPGGNIRVCILIHVPLPTVEYISNKIFASYRYLLGGPIAVIKVPPNSYSNRNNFS